MTDPSLQKIRKQIDRIDNEIMELLYERFHLLPQVVDYKLRRHLPVQDEDREVEMFRLLEKKAKQAKLRPHFIRDLYKGIISESRDIQKEIITKKKLDLKQLKEYPIGSLVPIYETVKLDIDIDDYFAVLSDYGRKPNCFLLESADIVPKYGEYSFGCADPCIKVRGEGEHFIISALNHRGEKFLSFLKGKFDFVDDLEEGKREIRGRLKAERKVTNEEERLNLKTHIDILRTISFAFDPVEKPFGCYGGLFGLFTHDFIDQFEDLPSKQENLYQNPDYEFFFADHLFMADHKGGRLHLITNALITDSNYEEVYADCQKTIRGYREALSKKPPKILKKKSTSSKFYTDCSKEEYIRIVKKCKDHIVKGDVFQIVPSRTMYKKCNEEPFDVYVKLKKLNPSPYMAYINFGEDGVLVGSSPEMCLRVQGEREKVVEIRPIAGTRPRGFDKDGNIDTDLDGRYEMELKTDEKELAEHAMLIDLARNDIARVCKPGTRIVDECLTTEKYSHVQHLVSNVKGILKDDLDAFHVYLASMNMGTLNGAPKVKAMELLRKYEKTKRGFYGGTVAKFDPSGDMDSMIVIRTIWMKDGVAYLRAGAGVVYDSVPEKEYEETEKKMAACLEVLD